MKTHSERMRYFLFLVFVNLISSGFSQQDSVPKIDLIILVSYDDLLPVVNAKVTVSCSDGKSVIGYTDKNGRLEYLHNDELSFIVIGKEYSIKVEGNEKQYGSSDSFSTDDVFNDTRIIRGITVSRI